MNTKALSLMSDKINKAKIPRKVLDFPLILHKHLVNTATKINNYLITF